MTPSHTLADKLCIPRVICNQFSYPAKSKTAKKLPKLRSRFVNPSQPSRKDETPASEKSTPTESVQPPQQEGPVAVPDTPVSSTSLTSPMDDSTSRPEKNETVPGGSELCNKVATEVSKMIGEIANFYGSGSADYLGNTGETRLTGDVSLPPQVSSEETTVTSLPSYAPEKVLTDQANYHTSVEAENSDKMASLSEDSHNGPSNASPVEESVGVAMLENMLVTERDIFGDDDNGMSDDDDDVRDDDDDVSAINSNVGDDVVPEPVLPSAEELASIEEEFKKVTALPRESAVATEQTTKKKVSKVRWYEKRLLYSYCVFCQQELLLTYTCIAFTSNVYRVLYGLYLPIIII